MAYMDPKDHLGRLGTTPRTLTHTVTNNHGRDDNYEEPPDERKNFPASSLIRQHLLRTALIKQEPNVNLGDEDAPSVENQVQDPPEEEGQGITHCVCGSAGTLYVLSSVS